MNQDPADFLTITDAGRAELKVHCKDTAKRLELARQAAGSDFKFRAALMAGIRHAIAQIHEGSSRLRIFSVTLERHEYAQLKTLAGDPSAWAKQLLLTCEEVTPQPAGRLPSTGGRSGLAFHLNESQRRQCRHKARAAGMSVEAWARSMILAALAAAAPPQFKPLQGLPTNPAPVTRNVSPFPGFPWSQVRTRQDRQSGAPPLAN